jgi:hypothetical protein
MSKEDFDRFLALLGGFLKLDKKQRLMISDELRDHLEMRVEALVGAGVDESNAQQQALEEFGDAAGVAARFAFLSQMRTRRRIMKIASISMLVAIPVVIATILFWPETRNRGLNLPVASAQDEDPVVKSENESSDAESADSQGSNILSGKNFRPTGVNQQLGVTTSNPEDLAAEAKLELPFSVDSGSIFQDVVENITQNVGLQVILDESAKDTITRDTEIEENFSLHEISLRSALDLLLKKYDCTFTIKDGMLVILSEDEAESEQIIRVYDVSDIVEHCGASGLTFHKMKAGDGDGRFGKQSTTTTSSTNDKVAMSAGGGGIGTPREFVPNKPETVQSLVLAVSEIVEPDSWEANGGSSRIVALGDRLVVSAPFGVNYKIKTFLQDLRANMQLK